MTSPDKIRKERAPSPSTFSLSRFLIRFIFVVLALCFLAVWYLLFQHHITFKTFEDVLWQDSPHFAASRLFGNATIKSDDPSVFSSRIVEQAVFTNYDTDKDGKLGHDEFQLFLSDLAKSRMLPQLAGKEGPVHDEDGDSKKPAAVVVAAKETEGTPSSPPPLSPSPPPLASHCPELSKELIASFARDKTIMLTVCDWRIFETFGINWMKHLRELKVDYFIVGATDSSTSLFLSSGDGKHPCFKFFEEGAEAMMKKDYKYGDDHYRAATWRKVTVVEKIVDWGFNVLHSDVDVVWFRDPLPYFLGPALAAVDVATSTDLITSSNPVGDEGLELAIFQHCNVNTGVYFVKSSEGGKFFMAQWADLRERLKGDNDQTGLYQWLRGNKADIDHAQRRLVYQLGPKPSVALISVGMLLNGYSYFIPRLHERKKVKPLGIHMTWLPLSKEGKFHRMRDGMLYHEKPEYFNDPLFITADLDFPSSPPDYNTWMDTEAMVQFHLKAMDKQLIQVYRVMAIALILNRTLIFPKMQCFCYKNWFMSEQCKIPGDKNTIFPIECHLDQWLRPKVLYNYGAKIVGSDGVPRAFDFREHSALENPRFPKISNKSFVNVVPGDGPPASSLAVKCDDATQQCSLTVPKMMKQNQLVESLASLKSIKVIRLKKPMRLFGGFDDLKLKESFEAFVDKVAANWCCRDKPLIDKGWKEKEKLSILESLNPRPFMDKTHASFAKNFTIADPDW